MIFNMSLVEKKMQFNNQSSAVERNSTFWGKLLATFFWVAHTTREEERRRHMWTYPYRMSTEASSDTNNLIVSIRVLYWHKEFPSDIDIAPRLTEEIALTFAIIQINIWFIMQFQLITLPSFLCYNANKTTRIARIVSILRLYEPLLFQYLLHGDIEIVWYHIDSWEVQDNYFKKRFSVRMTLKNWSGQPPSAKTRMDLSSFSSLSTHFFSLFSVNIGAILTESKMENHWEISCRAKKHSWFLRSRSTTVSAP